jgi:hypothetical protein
MPYHYLKAIFMHGFTHSIAFYYGVAFNGSFSHRMHQLRQQRFRFGQRSHRYIGHQILLSSGDRSSRVLPVKKTNNYHYQIRFASALEISPDSVIKIVGQAVHINHLPADYIVNVVESKNNDIVYGFAILKTEQTSLLPCKGRKLPKAHYAVNINFRNKRNGVLNKEYILGAGGSLAAMMLIFSGL